MRSGATELRRIEPIAAAQRVEDGRRGRTVRIQAALLGASAGTLADRGVQVQLQVGVGQDDRADVATGHHDPAAPGQVALALEQGRPDLGHGRDRGHRRVDGRIADVGRVIDAIDEHAGEAPVAVRGELDVVDERDEALRVVHRHATGLGQPGHGAIQQARVAEPVADLAGGRRADAALARRARAVERHDQSSHRSQDSRHSPADRARTASSRATNSSGG